MNERDFSWKSFVITVAIVFCATYVLVVVLFGIIWDPNGANLLERPPRDTLRIIFIGLYKSIPLGVGTFWVNHPVTMTMSAGLLALAGIGLIGRRNQTGRHVLYALVALLTALGTVQFFLMA